MMMMYSTTTMTKQQQPQQPQWVSTMLTTKMCYCMDVRLSEAPMPQTMIRKMRKIKKWRSTVMAMTITITTRIITSRPKKKTKKKRNQRKFIQRKTLLRKQPPRNVRHATNPYRRITCAPPVKIGTCHDIGYTIALTQFVIKPVYVVFSFLTVKSDDTKPRSKSNAHRWLRNCFERHSICVNSNFCSCAMFLFC